jgi:F0F1-type ATP synthase assembly protein I
MSVKTKLARKAVKSTAKHTAHGAASKATRAPFRSITLLTAGALIGLAVGWLLANGKSTEGPSETGAVS